MLKNLTVWHLSGGFSEWWGGSTDTATDLIKPFLHKVGKVFPSWDHSAGIFRCFPGQFPSQHKCRPYHCYYQYYYYWNFIMIVPSLSKSGDGYGCCWLSQYSRTAVAGDVQENALHVLCSPLIRARGPSHREGVNSKPIGRAPPLLLEDSLSIFGAVITLCRKIGRGRKGRVPGRTGRRSRCCGFAEVVGFSRAEL